MAKYTYIDALNEVLANNTISAQAHEKLTTLLDQPFKSNDSNFDNSIKKRAVNADFAMELLEVMKRVNKPSTITEYMKKSKTFISMNNQKVTAIMYLLILDGKAKRVVIKNRSYFALKGE